ncbi:MAG: hypothetical protein IPK65_08545 [Gammaproteobacteria bacterium]|nr:hypothetical protein [Gammaproteobacteria bacterium]
MIENLSHLYGYLNGMWRYRWSALLIAWIVAVAGWLTVYAIPDQYEVRAVVYIDADSVMKPLLKGLAVESDVTDDLDVMSRMLMSRENLLTVIRETDMDLEAHSPQDQDRLVADLASSIRLKGGKQIKASGCRKIIFTKSATNPALHNSHIRLFPISSTP